jgi:Domain of unknown function (DUF4281)
MSLESIFSICSAIAMAGWLALAVAPLARPHCIGFARVASAILCIAYLIEALTITVPTNGNFSTLAGVSALFAAPGNVMLGWTHFLAFDLFIGSWEIEDAGREGIAHWAMLPLLVLTLMLGPIGLLSYLVVRSIDRLRKGRPLLARSA